jgi:hypothetical protein
MVTRRTPSSSTTAQVRSGVVAALVVATTHRDEALRRSLPQGRFGLDLVAPGLHRRLRFADGLASEASGGRADATLWFPREQDIIATLAGGSGRVVPLPGGLGFTRAVAAFKASTGRVGELMALDGDALEAQLETAAALILAAALRGVCEVGMHDDWTAARSRRMPDGIIAVQAGDLRGWVQREGPRMTAGGGDAPARANAVLDLRSPRIAHGLLSGKIDAMAALGTGEVAIRGRLPLVRTLLPLLARFGEVMGGDHD